MNSILFGIAVIIAVAQASSTPARIECMSDSDCGDNGCCYKKHEFLVVSKKRQTFEGYPLNHVDLAHTKGECQSYHALGESCSPYDATNGYCSCNAKQGHTCQSIVTKRAIFNPMSRTYKCTPLMTVSKK